MHVVGEGAPSAQRTRACRGVRRDGTACRASAGPSGSGYCFGHDPALAAARAKGRSAGGKGRGVGARLRRAVPADLRDVLVRLVDALEQTHDGTIEPRVASAMGSLAGAIVRVYEVGELALRVEKLESETRDRDRDGDDGPERPYRATGA